jgi:hypothetical protein
MLAHAILAWLRLPDLFKKHNFLARGDVDSSHCGAVIITLASNSYQINIKLRSN